MADSETTESEVKKKLRRLKALEDVRRDVITVCKDITTYILPRRGKYLSLGETSDQTKADKYSKIIKNTAARAHRILKAGMHTGLTNQARPWFRLTISDQDLLGSVSAVGKWLDKVARILRDILAGSNFYETIYSFYGEQSGFGTAIMFIEKDPVDVIRCRLFNMGEYCIACDEKGRVNTVYRRFYMTAGQIKSRWPNTISPKTKDLADKPSSEDQKLQVVHIIEPRQTYDPTKMNASQMPWRSCYFEYENHEDKFLSESGFNEFPCMCGRWEVLESNEYGDSPCMEILPDVKMLQEIEKTSIAAMHKTLDPTVVVPASFKNKFSKAPGTVIFKDVSKDEMAGPLFQINYDIASAEAKAQEIVRDIKEALFNDLFMMIASMEGTQPLTATEVLERREEKMSMLGPVVERDIVEVLGPAIIRTYNIADREGKIPPAPNELRGNNIKLEFVSILAQALKLTGVQGIQGAVNFVLGMSQIKPDIIDIIDLDEAGQRYADYAGAPASIIRTDSEVAELRKARMEEQKKMQMMQEMGAALEGAKTASETDTEGKNMLTDVARAAANV